VATSRFQGLFRSDTAARDKFFSRLFGIFNEEIVRCWGKAPQAPYEDLGRPTIKPLGAKRGYTLDFTFRSKSDGRIYIAEMKCELEYENYRYLTLESPSQLDHHGKDAFRIFLDAARNTRGYCVTVKGRPQTINGSILIWGRYTEQGRTSVIAQHGFADILSLEAIIHELLVWQNQDYADLIQKYETWCGEFFAALSSLCR
jgi:hypothetical protein